jgi:hypothetical protein
VIQELALAKSATVHWGDADIRWQNFADAIALFMTKHDKIMEILGSKPVSFSEMGKPSEHVGALDPRALGANTLVNATSNLFRRSEDGEIHQRLLTLEVLVSSLFLPFEASDPKDTIYAVLSLAKDTSARIDITETPSWRVPPRHQVLLKMMFWLVMWILKLPLIPLVLLLAVLWNNSSEHTPTDNEMSIPIDDRVTPDYDKTLTDVYADFMEYCIEKSDSLDILCRHWAPLPKELTTRQRFVLFKKGQKEEKEMLPTWIPTIDGHAYGGPLGVLGGRKNGDCLVGGLGRLNQQEYNASEDLRPCVKFGKRKAWKEMRKRKAEGTIQKSNTTSPVGLEPIPEISDKASNLPPRVERTPAPVSQPKSIIRKFDGKLQVKGFLLDIIGEKLTGRVLNGVIPAEAFQYGGWESRQGDEAIPDHVPDQLWRTLVADRGPNGTNAPTWYRRACLECLMHTNSNGDFNTLEFRNRLDTPVTMKAFLDRVRSVIWCRKFFLTDGRAPHKPHFGLAPPKTKEGDLICILFGCSVPVILRKISNKGKGLYQFIGACYVHGSMDGEALPAQRAKRSQFPYKDVPGFTLV